MSVPASAAALVAELPSAVVRAARTMHERGLVVSSLGNVSVRHDDGLIITPTRWPYGMLQVPDLVALGPDGTLRAGTREPSSDWRVHQAVYKARPDIRAIVHTHSTWATAWGWAGRPLTLPTEERRYLEMGDIEVAGRAEVGSAELATNVVRALGANHAVLMARHGVLTVGRDPMAALELAEVVEREAQLTVIVSALGTAPRPHDA